MVIKQDAEQSGATEEQSSFTDKKIQTASTDVIRDTTSTVQDTGESVTETKPEGELEPDKPITFKSEAEFKAHVAELVTSQAQSLKDKELYAMRKELNALKTERQKRTEEDEGKQTNAQVDAYLQKKHQEFTADGIPEAAVAAFEDTVRRVAQAERQTQVQAKQMAERESAVKENSKQSRALQAVFNSLYPEGNEARKRFDDMLKSVIECETDREMNLTAKLLAAQTPTKSPKPRTTPDGGVSTTSGNSENAIINAFNADPEDNRNLKAYMELMRKKK